MGDLDRATVPMLIAFVDLSGFARQAARIDDDVIAAVLDGWYERCASHVGAAGGRVVKFIGDAALIVFDAARADDGIAALFALKADGDAYLAAAGWACHANVKAHVGPCVAGSYGAAGDKRFDVIGKSVNTAARLPTAGVALSADAIAAIGPALRGRFEERGGTYIAR
jgi:adenylate cyclase